ncbi:MAG: PPOX class F420-dependent oxidoreductase [Streptosporangiaceae bacterium]
MAFTDAEQAYLGSQPLGRLATVQADGSPQVKPVGFRVNPRLGTIDVPGFNLTSSQKFRNVARNGHAALVVDDIAEALGDDTDDGPLIRIHPTRILSYGVEEPPGEPHETQMRSRDLAS